MGVPKFFRYISERYPCLSETVKEYQIPEFDNLYLDMNGIIHVCSHPDDSDPHFRITEEKIFQDVFHYIEVLFRMIKPLKVFFMAIDGVAPRAKMNQQRSRRFRSAKEAERAEIKAKEQGESLPDQARFDSNCITPGTLFMAKLHEQLKYFVVSKISSDPLWQKCRVIFSGHETPGEGEHKIMDYIRYTRSQPGYDPNTRHCLYGLDADLIMLGLCTHEPHFSLLREEVRFGKQTNSKRHCVPEQIRFYLLHLSLMREYLELEFEPIRESLSFPFDIEKIIDDWVLMGFLVGNDFIPNLPNMHISNGALPILYKSYMKVLPTLDGYINEGGQLNLERFQKFVDDLSKVDMDNFSETYADLVYFAAKTGRKMAEVPLKERHCNLMNEKQVKKSAKEVIVMLHPDCSSDDTEEESSDADDDDDLLKEEFILHKKGYYIEKLEYSEVTPEVMKSQAEGYVRAIQWNLHYYYNGVCSWSWYYPHHYAPFISDIKNFLEIDLSFDHGRPFKPYEQLLAVLPPASKELLPKCYHPLMTEESSVLKKYYPMEFHTDLNGKMHEWEAVVLVPFIDEKVLLEAMDSCNKQLSLEELKRNLPGPMIIYRYTDQDLGEYKAPEYFMSVKPNHATFDLMDIAELRISREKLVKGAYPGVKMDVYYPGFPTMKHLKYRGSLEKAKVKVFQQSSRGYNMLLYIGEDKLEDKLSELRVKDVEPFETTAKELLGKTVFVGWPHLVEAQVVSVSNEHLRMHATKEGSVNTELNAGNLQQTWFTEIRLVKEHYKDRLGVVIGDTKVLLHVRLMTGRKYEFTQQCRLTYEKQWSDILYPYPLQTVVRDICAYSTGDAPYQDIEGLFPAGSFCFMLGHPHYGSVGKVLDSTETVKKGRLKIEMHVHQEPDFGTAHALNKEIQVNYMPLYDAAAKLGISKYLFSRITGTILVMPEHMKLLKSTEGPRVNIGLNLKFNKKNEEIPGYTKKAGTTWYYSAKVVDLMKSYMDKFPEVFECMNANSNNDVYYDDELFPGEDSKQKVLEISNWIKEQEYVKIEKTACGMCMLEPAVVQRIESVVDEFRINGKLQTKVATMQVKPYLLYNYNIQTGSLPPDPNTTFKLFDRVVNVRPSYTVPEGYTGTIIAIQKPTEGTEKDVLYDVVFDRPFPGGLAMNCSPNRGYRVPAMALINKSYGQRKLEEKTGKFVAATTAPPQNHWTNQRAGQQQQLYTPPKQQQQQHQNQQYYSQKQQNFPRYQPQQQQSNSAFASWPNQRQQFQHQQQQQQHYSPQKKQQNYGNSAAEAGKQPNLNLFMPTFNNGTAKKEQNENKVDTDFLKKMLGIDGAKVKPETSSNSGATVSNSVEKFFSNVKLPIQKDSGPLQQNTHKVNLIKYYQSKNLGMPRYQYYPYPPDEFVCQITTQDGATICGDPKRTKEDACEDVSNKQLNILKSTETNQIKLPTPPRQWCDKDKSPQKTTTNVDNKPSPRIPPFVPLQAVRSYKNKQSDKRSNPSRADAEDHTTATVEQQRPHSSDDGKSKNDSRREGTNKPKRQRKVRIAANFSNMSSRN